MPSRKFTRVLYERYAKIDKDGEIFEGEIKNLSLKGVYIETDKILTCDQKLSLIIPLNDQIDIKLIAKVVRVDDKGFATIFTEIDIDSFAHLKNLVSYNLGDFEQVNREFLDMLDSKY